MISKYFIFSLLFSPAAYCQVVRAAGTDQVSGRLTITVTDYFSEHRSETKYFISDQAHPGQSFELHFANEPRGDLQTGIMVHGTGHINGKFLESAALTVTSSPLSRSLSPQTVTTPSLPVITPTSGAQKTLIYVLTSPTGQSSFTNSQLSDETFGLSGLSVNTMYQQSSFGAVSFYGDVVGPYAITLPDTCDISNIQSQAEHAAVNAGVDTSAYSHRVYMMPNEILPLCAFGGYSVIGGTPGVSWINTGYYSPSNSFIYVVLAHELGHQLNMQHAQAIEEDGSLLEYGDNSCTMGDPADGIVLFNVPHLIQEGWIPLSHILQVTESGTYQVSSAETQTADKQALQIVAPGSTDTLYVSYRQPVGIDADLPSVFVGGVTIHFWKGSNNKNQLATYYPWGGALGDGQTYTYPGGSLTITQISHNSNSVTVSVNFERRIKPRPRHRGGP